MHLRLRHRRAPRGFSLLELLVATGVLSMVVVGLYAAFLKANEYAVTSRVNTTAKVILERAVNFAATVDWDASMDVRDGSGNYRRPEVLRPTAKTLYDLDDASQGGTLPALKGQVSLFRDPQQNDVIVGYLSRTVTEPDALDPLVQITFTLDNIRSNGRLLPPISTYTVRARNN